MPLTFFRASHSSHVPLCLLTSAAVDSILFVISLRLRLCLRLCLTTCLTIAAYFTLSLSRNPFPPHLHAPPRGWPRRCTEERERRVSLGGSRGVWVGEVVVGG